MFFFFKEMQPEAHFEQRIEKEEKKKKERIAVHTLFCAKSLTSLLSHVSDIHALSFFFSYQIKADIVKINREVITKKKMLPFPVLFFFFLFLYYYQL